MSHIKLHHDRDLSATYVPNHFIDHYMTAANGEYVKIYLYLLRCMNSSESDFSLSAAADKFEHTEKDIQRALKYWEKMNLLHLEYDEKERLSGIRFLDSDKSAPRPRAAGDRDIVQTAESQDMKDMAQAAESRNMRDMAQAAESRNMRDMAQAAESQNMIQTAKGGGPDTTQAPESPVSQAAPTRQRTYSASQLAAFQEKEAVSELLFVTEHYLKRPLTSTDIHTIFFWYEELKLPVDVMEYLIEYCVGKGHTSLRYMNKVALAWKEQGIRTVEQAKRASSSYSQLHFSVMKALGISGRNLVASETACIDKWSKTYGFTSDIIAEACRRTISATHQPSFEYTDGILRKWYEQGVHHLNDIAKLDSDYKKSKTAAALSGKAASPNRFNNFQQRTYDYDKLERQLLGGQQT